jgi:hypothetical protein
MISLALIVLLVVLLSLCDRAHPGKTIPEGFPKHPGHRSGDV